MVEDSVKISNDKIELEPLNKKKEERSSSVPHVTKTERQKIQRSQTEDKGPKKANSTESKTNTKPKRNQKNRNRNTNTRGTAIVPELSCTSLLFALLVRVMFSLHAGIAFWRVTVIKEHSLEVQPIEMPTWGPFLNLAGIGLLVIETFITLLYRGGKEYKWFCPCVFFYLMSIIPSLLMLEYDMFYRYVEDAENDCPSIEFDLSESHDRVRRAINDTFVTNATTLATQAVTTTISEIVTNGTTAISTTAMQAAADGITTTVIAVAKPNPDHDFIGKIIPDIINIGQDTTKLIGENVKTNLAYLESLQLESTAWVLGLHQVLLFFLVIGRWMLPRGGISREQLSQLLLVFIGTGADILEFISETIEEDSKSACSLNLHFVIWIVWGWSLFQFTLVLTASAGRKPRGAGGSGADANFGGCCTSCCDGYFSNPDVWGMVSTLILQDIPFLVARCYFIFELGMKSQMIIFFTLKNLLVVLLQLYRLGVLWSTRNKPREL